MNEPRCVNCNRLQCHGGPSCVSPDAPPASLTGVMQAPVATNLDPDTEGI